MSADKTREALPVAALKFASNVLIAPPGAGTSTEPLERAAIEYAVAQPDVMIGEYVVALQTYRHTGETFADTCKRLAAGAKWGQEWCTRVAIALKAKLPESLTWPQVEELARVTTNLHDSAVSSRDRIQADSNKALEQHREGMHAQTSALGVAINRAQIAERTVDRLRAEIAEWQNRALSAEQAAGRHAETIAKQDRAIERIIEIATGGK